MEAEAGESLEPRRWMEVAVQDPATALQPGDRARLHLRKRESKREREEIRLRKSLKIEPKDE